MPAIDNPAPHSSAQIIAVPGPRSAERLALWLMTHRKDRAEPLAELLLKLWPTVEACPACGFFTEKGAACLLCGNEKRDARLLCVRTPPHMQPMINI